MTTTSTTPLTSAELLATIETLTRKVDAATVVLLRAEDAYASEVRASALSGTPCNRSSLLDGLERARTKLAIERDTLAEAERLYAAAKAQERAAEDEATRAEIREMVSALASVAAEADAAYAIFLDKVTAAQKIERDVNVTSRTKLGPSFEIFGTLVPSATGDTIRHLTSLKNGFPTPLESWFADWAAKAARRTAQTVGF